MQVQMDYKKQLNNPNNIQIVKHMNKKKYNLKNYFNKQEMVIKKYVLDKNKHYIIQKLII